MKQGSTFKMLSLMHRILLTGQVLFGGISVYLVYEKLFLPPAADVDKILQVAALLISAAGVYAALMLFKKKIKQIRDMQSEAKEKLALYRSACMLQWALIEGPCIFCICCFLITGNYAFLALAGLLLFLFVLTAPSKIKMQLQLQISEVELDEL